MLGPFCTLFPTQAEIFGTSTARRTGDPDGVLRFHDDDGLDGDIEAEEMNVGTRFHDGGQHQNETAFTYSAELPAHRSAESLDVPTATDLPPRLTKQASPRVPLDQLGTPVDPDLD